MTAPTISITEELAAWARSSRESGFADEVLDSASIYVLDWLANALAGRGTGPGRALLDYGHGQSEGPCELLGDVGGRAPETAAFVNGALSHIVEMDDVDRASIIHAGAVVIPAALALAQREGVSGRHFLAAVVVGYEVAVRFGAAVGRKHYYHFHNTSTCGVFGAAAAAGLVLDLDERQLVWSLGNAGTMASGLWEFNTDGSMSKHLHAGQAAANGVRAADLARLGFTGSRTIVEGPRGFFAGMAPKGEPSLVLAGLGKDPLALPGVSLKPHASCRHTHAAVDAAIALRRTLAGRKVRSARVHVYRAAADLCDNPRPATPYEAKFSLQYCASRALQTGSVGLLDFAPEDIVRIETPVDVVVDPELDACFPERFPARLELTLEDGTSLTEEVRSPLGDPENPLSREQVEQKLRELAAFGGVSAEEAAGYRDWVNELREAPRATARSARTPKARPTI